MLYGGAMKVVTIKINGQTASKRTRNRIKENGPDFELKDRNNQTLLKSINGGWFGWLPDNEFVIVKTLEK